MTDPESLLRALFAAAVEAASPARCLPPFLAMLDPGPLIVLGAGKAAASMAHAVETAWPAPVSGLVVTPRGHGMPCRHVRVLEAGHPMPDAASRAAGQALLAAASAAPPDAQILFVISGGGSALLGQPLPGMTPEAYAAMQAALLASGAPIDAINCLRRHVSALAGGRLALACPASRQLSLILSDVPNDAAHAIASGPTVPDPTQCAEALAVADRWHIPLPAAMRAALAHGTPETVKPGDPRLARARHAIIANAATALAAAARAARAAGITPHILGDAIEGEARHVGTAFAGIARQVAIHAQPFAPPCVLLSGGELSVTLGPRPGRGGRNTSFLLSLALALDGQPTIHALAADTDGIDGSGTQAGAIIHPDTLARAAARGLDARAMLDADQSADLFHQLNDTVITGPTRTNVNDFRAILVLG